jgi:hypothetical protein
MGVSDGDFQAELLPQVFAVFGITFLHRPKLPAVALLLLK